MNKENKICKKCGFTEAFHPHKNIFIRQEGRKTITSTCKKFEPQEDCGHSDALHKKYGMGDDCKPKNHSHPEALETMETSNHSGSDNSFKQKQAHYWNKPEDTLSSKIFNNNEYNIFPEDRGKVVLAEDIKDFIKKLNKLKRPKHEKNKYLQCWSDGFNCCLDELNKLAGAELT